MADPAPAPAPADPAAPPAPAAWHAGIEPEILGHWQNKNYDLADPKTVAIESTKAAIQAQRFVGHPADRLLKLPAGPSDEAGWKEVWTKLGVPAEAKDYDFKDVKFADGSDIDAALAEPLRQALLQAKVAKENAPTVVKTVVKFLEDAEKATAAERGAKIAAENETLRRNWGNNFDFNLLKAQEGVRRSGISREAVDALEGVIGKAAVMEHFRKIGAIASEDVFHESGTANTPGGAMTMEAAQARIAELQRDREWGAKLLKGDPAVKREFDNLSRLATGIMETT